MADLPPTDAVIVAEPTVTGVTTPSCTVATAVLSDDQTILLASPEGSTVAVMVPVVPPFIKVIAGVMDMELTLATSLIWIASILLPCPTVPATEPSDTQSIQP